jgi:RimJ/RimL family protein N-acetyltransferase
MIAGSKVTLRPVAASDLPVMRTWFSNPSVMRFWGNHRPFVTERKFEDDLEGRFARFEESGCFTILGPKQEPIGRIEYMNLSMRSRSAELGILIGEESAQGKGYGPDAIVALLGYLFYERNLHRVGLTVLVTNQRAIRAYEKIGFVHEGRYRAHRFVDGAYEDEYQMSILRPEFDARYRNQNNMDRPAERN